VTTEAASHKALVPAVFIAKPAAGEHTLSVADGPATNTDANDYFNVTVVELP